MHTGNFVTQLIAERKTHLAMGSGRGNGFDQTPVKGEKVIKHLIWTVPKPKI